MRTNSAFYLYLTRVGPLYTYFHDFYPRRLLQTMSFFSHAKNILVQGNISATQVNGNVYNAQTNVTSTQNNYHGGPLKGALLGDVPLVLLPNLRGWSM